MYGSTENRDESHEESCKAPAKSRIDSDILNSIFDDFPQIMILINQNGKVENINRVTSITLGKEKKDSFGLLGGELFGCVNSFKREGCGKNRECSECIIRNSVIHTFETGENIHKKEGELEIVTNYRSVTLMFLISTILIQHNKEQFVLLTADDITDQKLAEKEALEVSAKNEAILNLLPDLIFECKRDGIIVNYRTSIEDDLYVLPNEFLGKKIIEILPKELAWKTMHSIEQTIQTKELQSFQYQLPMNGKMVDFEARLVACGEDSALVIVSDITERKRIEKDLRESEEKFKTIFENANDAIYLTDLNGQFLEVNQMACDQLGYSRSELIQMNPHDIDSSDDPAQVKNRINQLLQDGHILFETAHVRKDGSIMPVEASVRLIDYMGEKGFLAISRDITNHKQAEKMIREKAEAEAANISKSKFLTNMSHELRTPLNSIIGFSQLLNSNPFGNLNEKETKYSYNIMTSGKHLLDLINDILDISKIESGEMELECEKFTLSSFICDMVNIIKHLADEKNIEICNQFRSESIEMHADRLRMKQILYNLLSNSLKFTPENGCI